MFMNPIQYWQSGQTEAPGVTSAISIISRVYGIANGVPWTDAGKQEKSNFLRRVFGQHPSRASDAVRAYLKRSSPKNLTFYVVADDTRFTVLLMYELLRLWRPNDVFVFAEGQLPKTHRQEYFCVEFPGAHTGPIIAYDYSLYLIEVYRSIVESVEKKSPLTYKEMVAMGPIKRQYERIQYFDEAEFHKHLAWVSLGIELLTPLPQYIFSESWETDEGEPIFLKNHSDRCYGILYSRWLALRMPAKQSKTTAASEYRPSSSVRRLQGETKNVPNEENEEITEKWSLSMIPDEDETSGTPAGTAPEQYAPQQGGYASQRQGGYAPPQRQAGYVPQQGGYVPPQRQSGYAPQRQSGYAPQRQSGYAPQRQSGYAPQRQSGYAPQQGRDAIQAGPPTTAVRQEKPGRNESDDEDGKLDSLLGALDWEAKTEAAPAKQQIIINLSAGDEKK